MCISEGLCHCDWYLHLLILWNVVCLLFPQVWHSHQVKCSSAWSVPFMRRPTYYLSRWSTSRPTVLVLRSVKREITNKTHINVLRRFAPKLKIGVAWLLEKELVNMVQWVSSNFYTKKKEFTDIWNNECLNRAGSIISKLALSMWCFHES